MSGFKLASYREERVWKCLTRRAGSLGRTARARLRAAAAQVEVKLAAHPQVCSLDQFGCSPGVNCTQSSYQNIRLNVFSTK